MKIFPVFRNYSIQGFLYIPKPIYNLQPPGKRRPGCNTQGMPVPQRGARATAVGSCTGDTPSMSPMQSSQNPAISFLQASYTQAGSICA